MQLEDPESHLAPGLYHSHSQRNIDSDWEDIVKRKREQRDKLLPSEWKLRPPTNSTSFSPLNQVLNGGLLTPEELDWTDTAKYDATETARRIAAGEVTAEQIVTAFCKRATAATSLANILTEINFEQAIARAKELDGILNSTGKTVGPLHGVPITIKDSQDLQGFDTTEGLTALANDPAQENGALTQILIDAGAIIIAKTNMPQTGLAADSNSIVWGRTLNAHNSRFGAGGSSGGEGTAIATGSSLFGVGTDGAGSCRMPGHANGVIGYRASGYRIPDGGRERTTSPGRSGITMTGPVAGGGFFAHSVRDVRAVAKIVSDARGWERQNAFLYPTPWMNVSAPQKPRIGVWDVEHPNTFIHLFPPMLRGYKKARERLAAAGFELVPFTPPDQSLVWQLCKDFLLFQGIENLVALLAHEPITKIVRNTDIVVPQTPRFPISVEQLYELNNRLLNISSHMDQEWNKDGKPLDALLSVTAGNTALPFDEWFDTSYTSIYNTVDWPAINLPLNMTVDKDIDKKYGNFSAFSKEDARLMALYDKDPESFHGLPLSVQLAGRKFQDEKLLAIAEMIHPILQGN